MIDLTNSDVKKTKVIVMIPAYNEEKTIGKVIEGIPREISGVSEVRVMVMDDCSPDGTIEAAKRAGADHIFKQKQNAGLGRNFKKGIDCALRLGADIIVNIDADGQFDSRDVVKIIQPILKHEADMVTCTRFANPEMTKNMPWIKKWGNRRFTNLVNRITGKKFTDTQCGFRAYSREAALRMNLNGKFTYTQESFIDLVEKGMVIKEIPLEVKYFKERNSKVSGNLSKYGFRSLGIIAKTTRDTQPLTFFGLPAIIIFGLGFAGGLASFIYWIIEHATTPVKTLFQVSVFFMIFGLLLFILGLVADMLRTIKRSQDEILYRLKRADIGGNGNGLIEITKKVDDPKSQRLSRWRK
jgi:glycosyltransferase involved in cell wall biosynthesis